MDDFRKTEKSMLVEQWYRMWFDTYKTPVICLNTKRYYMHVFDKHILPAIGFMYVDEVKQIHVKMLINKLNEAGYQWETQNKVRLLIHDMYRYAIDNDYAIKNPANGVKLGKQKSKGRMALTTCQQKEFFQYAQESFYYNLFVVAVNTGLRPGELCALEESDLNFDKHLVSVSKTLLYQKLEGDEKKEFHLGPPKTRSSVRNVPINSICENALKKQISLKADLAKKNANTGGLSGLLFVTKYNTPICSSVLNHGIRKIVGKINSQREDKDLFPEFSAHTFRHTFATRCIEAGIHPKTLQSFLGHATLQMTMDLYVHVTEDFQQEEIRKLETQFCAIAAGYEDHPE